MKSIKSFTIGLLTGAILFGSIATAAAATGDINIKAILASSIKMKLYGQDFTPRDSQGNYYKPITYNSSNYLPVRAIAEAVHMPVTWDGATKTIWLGGKIGTVNVDNTKLYKDESYTTVLTTDSGLLTTPEKTYKWGITNDKPLNSVYFRCIFKPNNEYSHFKTSIFLADDVKKPFTIDFRKENKEGLVLKSVTVNPGQTVEVDFDIATVYSIYMESQAGTISKVIIGEPQFENTVPATTLETLK